MPQHHHLGIRRLLVGFPSTLMEQITSAPILLDAQISFSHHAFTINVPQEILRVGTLTLFPRKVTEQGDLVTEATAPPCTFCIRQPVSHRPGLFGLLNPCLACTLGCSSFMTTSSVISAGPSTSNRFSGVTPHSRSAISRTARFMSG